MSEYGYLSNDGDVISSYKEVDYHVVAIGSDILVRGKVKSISIEENQRVKYEVEIGDNNKTVIVSFNDIVSHFPTVKPATDIHGMNLI